VDVSYSPSAGDLNPQLKVERLAREAEARLFHGRRQFAALLGDGISSAYDWADAMLAEEKARYGGQ
jgi:hypothetical protein